MTKVSPDASCDRDQNKNGGERWHEPWHNMAKMIDDLEDNPDRAADTDCHSCYLYDC